MSETIAEKKRFKLVLQFDGSRYRGWQKQDDARSVQGALLTAARALYGDGVDVQGCGRTDAGVHALSFVAHLEATTAQGPGEVGRRLNEALPRDIVVRECKKAGPRFHARHHCLGRSYLYQVARQRSAFCDRYAWTIPEPLALGPMRDAAALLTGMHDFSSFTDRKALGKKSPLVMVNAALVVDQGHLVLVRIVGSHFLWKMVRRMVGVLVEVGRGTMPASGVERFLAAAEDLSRFTAPAQGLFLERAFYAQEELDAFLGAEEVHPYFF